MALFILLLSLLPVLMLPGPAAAQESELPAVQFGLVGLAWLQTARLNVVNTHTPPNPIEPCHVSLQFLNELGEPFPGVIAEADLLPGQATLLDLPAAMAFQGSTAFRRLFRASVFYPNPGPPEVPNPCAGLVNTLELVDTLTGRTQLVYSAIPTPGPPD